jgi:hypothetical protein
VRTTINIAPDVEAEIERLRREEGLGISEAINVLARRGMAASAQRRTRLRVKPTDLGLRVDVTNVAEVLDALDDR